MSNPKYLILEWWITPVKVRYPRQKEWTHVSRFYSHIKSPNGRIVYSGQAYDSMSDVRTAIKALRTAGTNLKVKKRKNPAAVTAGTTAAQLSIS